MTGGLWSLSQFSVFFIVILLLCVPIGVLLLLRFLDQLRLVNLSLWISFCSRLPMGGRLADRDDLYFIQLDADIERWGPEFPDWEVKTLAHLVLRGSRLARKRLEALHLSGCEAATEWWIKLNDSNPDELVRVACDERLPAAIRVTAWDLLAKLGEHAGSQFPSATASRRVEDEPHRQTNGHVAVNRSK